MGAYVEQLLLGEGRRGVVEVQDGGRRLDDVSVAVSAAEAVVSGQAEVLVAAAAVSQLKHLAGNHRLLPGYTGTSEPPLNNQLDGRRQRINRKTGVGGRLSV